MQTLADFGRALAHVLVLRPALRLIFGVAVHGRSNLPRERACLVAANHNSHLDVLLLFAALPVRRIPRSHVVAARDYFARNRLLFTLVNWLFRPVWVDRERGGTDPLAEMGTLLDAGETVILFPEGTRGEAGSIAAFRGGVGRLLERHRHVPLVPVFLLGPERALPRKAPFPTPLWNHVFVGPPLQLRGGADDIVRALRHAILSIASSETANRHQRRPERRKAIVVAVLGIDGSGKSTLSGRLARSPSGGTACLIGDRLELFTDGTPRAAQPLLKETLRSWINRRVKRAKSLGAYKVPKMAELLLRDALLGEATRWYHADLVVMDGSPALNMTAWATLYREGLFDEARCAQALRILSGTRVPRRHPLLREIPELRVMRRLGLTQLALPDAAVFLDADPAVCVDRIDRRGQEKQVHETVEKLSRLRDAYRVVVSALQNELGKPTITIDGALSIEDAAARARTFIEDIRRQADCEERPR